MSILLNCVFLGNVLIDWINNTSAYVGLYQRDQAAVALSTLSQSDSYSIMTYSKRQAQLLGLKIVPVSPHPKPKQIPNISKTSVNKRKRISNIPKQSIESIEEEPEQNSSTPLKTKKFKTDSPSPILKESGKERKISKTFEEDDSWN